MVDFIIEFLVVFLLLVSVVLLVVLFFGLMFVGFQVAWSFFVSTNSSFRNFEYEIFEDKTKIREYLNKHFPGVYLIISVLDVALFLILLLFLVNPIWDKLYGDILSLTLNVVVLFYTFDILLNTYILFKLYGPTPSLITKIIYQCFSSFIIVLISWYFGPSVLVFVRKLTLWMLGAL
jgi:hypothetical protein